MNIYWCINNANFLYIKFFENKKFYDLNQTKKIEIARGRGRINFEKLRFEDQRDLASLILFLNYK